MCLCVCGVCVVNVLGVGRGRGPGGSWMSDVHLEWEGTLYWVPTPR